jgi:hypothetical protein
MSRFGWLDRFLGGVLFSFVIYFSWSSEKHRVQTIQLTEVESSSIGPNHFSIKLDETRRLFPQSKGCASGVCRDIVSLAESKGLGIGEIVSWLLHLFKA